MPPPREAVAPPADGGLGAFVDYPPVPVANAAAGPLAGLTLGVKDIIDVAGYPTGGGQPSWRAEARPAARTASVVAALLGAGARFIAKTQTDELAYSLNGDNFHYGTPRNPAAPARLPGGSSSGSASATAGGAVDIGLGSDTGGSVRAPASFCGLFGIRTTHGRIPLDGFMPLAPTYDTAGWFARDAATFAKVAGVLVPGESPAIRRLLIAEDAFALATSAGQAAFSRALLRLERGFGRAPASVARITLGFDFPRIYEAFRDHQAFEAWQSHGAWIERVHPVFGPATAARFAFARTLTARQRDAAAEVRATVRARLDAILADGATAIVLPGAPDAAPLLTAPAADLDAFRSRALSLLCLAGHSGLPQVSVPGLRVSDAPLGLGLLGSRGADGALVALAGSVAALIA